MEELNMQEIVSEKLFNRLGQEVSDESSSCCKIKTKGLRDFYFIKANSSRMLYNPHGFPNESNLNDRHLGQLRWRYVEVKKEVYDTYINFLKGNNEVLLRQAQRRFENE